jgi:phosphoribosylanthranilate isomerase
MPFRVKICGITNVDDAFAAVEAGADAIGLNFFSGSRRCIGAAEAARIVQALGEQACPVGIFVNAAADTIREIRNQTNVELVQLHGDEPPTFLKELRGLPTIRVRRLGRDGMQAIESDLHECRRASGFAPAAVLIDAAMTGEFGGTGRTADWDQIAAYREWLGDVPLILAGGLTPENVAEAIRIVEPYAVDVASGVESSPGKKDRAKMHDFIAAAQAAFASHSL